MSKQRGRKHMMASAWPGCMLVHCEGPEGAQTARQVRRAGKECQQRGVRAAACVVWEAGAHLRAVVSVGNVGTCLGVWVG